MEITITALAWALFALLGLSRYQKLCNYLSVSQFKRLNACKKSRKYPHKDPILGLDLFLAAGKAMKRCQFLSFTRTSLRATEEPLRLTPGVPSDSNF